MTHFLKLYRLFNLFYFQHLASNRKNQSRRHKAIITTLDKALFASFQRSR